MIFRNCNLDPVSDVRRRYERGRALYVRQKMKLVLIAILAIATYRAPCGELRSPDGQYEIEYFDALPHESNVRLKNAKTGKILSHAFSNGYEESSYLETAWSSDSRYLAVVERRTRTTAEVSVFAFSGDSVENVRLPDYRLNLLGHRKLVDGGRYHWASKLRWDKSMLTFYCNGQWIDASGDPEINPGNWYHFNVSITFGGAGSSPNPRLASVAVSNPTKQEGEQASTGQSASRPLPELKASDKPQPEAEGRSR